MRTVLLLLCAAAAALPAGEADVGQAFIGYRNDGTGVFPADCRLFALADGRLVANGGGIARCWDLSE